MKSRREDHPPWEGSESSALPVSPEGAREGDKLVGLEARVNVEEVAPRRCGERGEGVWEAGGWPHRGDVVVE